MDDERAREGLGHLQAATLELVAAARAFLDVVEDVVRDPGTGEAVAAIVSTVGQALRQAARPAGQGSDQTGGVERIRVS